MTSRLSFGSIEPGLLDLDWNRAIACGSPVNVHTAPQIKIYLPHKRRNFQRDRAYFIHNFDTGPDADPFFPINTFSALMKQMLPHVSSSPQHRQQPNFPVSRSQSERYQRP